MPPPVRIHSVGSSSWIEFRDYRHVSADHGSFLLEARFQTFGGLAEVSTHPDNTPARLFREAAAQWRGWDGAKRWEASEGELDLCLTSDRSGHFGLSVDIVDGELMDVRLSGVIRLEPIGLDPIAEALTHLFDISH
jgi:hypothetical protein